MGIRSRWHGAGLAAAALTMAAGGLAAQETDADWLANCRRNRDHDKRDRRTYCEVRQSGFRAGNRTVSADAGANGGVSFVGWDRDSVSVHARIQGHAESDEAAREIARQVQIVSAPTGIVAEGPANRRRESWSVVFLVYVPRRSSLEAHAQNGPVEVTGVEGRMELTTVNGPLQLTDVGGDVHARVQNGPLGVALGGRTWVGKGLDAETVNGPLQLEIPQGYSARLESGTVNGPMSLQFPLTITVQGRMTNRISTVLGDGGPTVRAVTTNGPITISRR